MFDRVCSRPHRVARAVRPIGVNRQLAAETVRGIGGRLDLIESEGLESLRIAHVNGDFQLENSG